MLCFMGKLSWLIYCQVFPWSQMLIIECVKRKTRNGVIWKLSKQPNHQQNGFCKIPMYHKPINHPLPYWNIIVLMNLFLRIQLKLNTALLSTVRPCVRSCVTGVTSHIFHIYKGINAMLIIRGPIKPYIF